VRSRSPAVVSENAPILRRASTAGMIDDGQPASSARVRWRFGIGRPTSDQQPRPRGAGVFALEPRPVRCDHRRISSDRLRFGLTALQAVPGILATCTPDSVLIAASESPPLPPGARSAGQTLTPSDGSVPRPSAGASRVDSRLAGAHALRYGHESGIGRRAGRRASRLPRRPSGTERGRRQLVVRD
jgi:hypothetical protein